MKYIDAELLRKEIERHLERATAEQEKFPDMPKYRWYLREGKKELCNDLLDYMYDALGVEEPITDYLQQEQPKVDLSEEIERFIDAHYHTRFDETLENGNDPLTVFDFEDIARHFCEFGLRKAAEMYDEIEYNRQRAEEESK